MRNAAVRDGLCEAFLAAEDAYLRHVPDFCGTISMEPLVSSEPGPAIYLTNRLNAAQRAAYASDLKPVHARFEKLLADVAEKTAPSFHSPRD